MEVGIGSPKGASWKSALNTPIFIKVWRHVSDQGNYRRWKWTVKTEYDVVLSASRLRAYMKFAPPFAPDGSPTYGVNVAKCDESCPGCRACHVGEANGVHGPLEVFSNGAVAAYAQAPELCELHIDWALIGEDWYIALCMDLLGARALDMTRNQLRDWGTTAQGSHHVKVRARSKEGWTGSSTGRSST